ncbi:Circadian clock-controlled protein [Camponotus japonicus]
MKYIAFGLILICCLARAIETNGYHISTKHVTLEKLVERVKNVLKTGNEQLGIPVLDPFFAEQTQFKLKQKEINLHVLLTNVNVSGLSEFKVLDGDIHLIPTDLKFNINLTWPLIIGSTNYKTSSPSYIDAYSFYGDSDINLSAQNFTLETEITFTVSEEHLKVKNMELKLSLKKLDFHIRDLQVAYNYEVAIFPDLLSELISEIAPEWLEDETFINNLKLFAIKKIDAFLSIKTAAEILEFLETI